MIRSREIRASYDWRSVIVYQAYPDSIADAALAAGTFVPPFRLNRMTWIKPSFCWMVCRSGGATKPGQERVLAVQVSRVGFEEALGSAVLTRFDKRLYANIEQWRSMLAASDVLVQWDPERTVGLKRLPFETIQIGLRGDAVRRYIDNWIYGIEDVTDLAKSVWHGDTVEIPLETVYPVPNDLTRRLGMIFISAEPWGTRMTVEDAADSQTLPARNMNLNIRYDAPPEIWDKMPLVYAAMDGWLGWGDGMNGQSGIPYWFSFTDSGDHPSLSASVEPSGLLFCGHLGDEEWAAWSSKIKLVATEILGYAIGDPEIDNVDMTNVPRIRD